MSVVALHSPPESGRLPRFPDQASPPRSLRDDQSRCDDPAIRRDFSWLAVGNVVNAACIWGRLALLARWGNAEMVGQWTLALAVCAPVGTLADLGLSGALISDARRQFRLRDYIGLRLLTCLLTIAVVAAAAGMGDYDAATARLVVLAGALVACESICDLFQAILQREERMHWVAVSLIVRGVVGLALFAAVFRLTHNLAWGACAFCLAALGTLLAIDVPRALACERCLRPIEVATRSVSEDIQVQRSVSEDRESLPRLRFGLLWFSSRFKPIAPSRISTKTLLRLAWLSLPLGLATASLSLITALPRYWISARLGNAALGGFAVAGSPMIAMSLIVGALSQAACPRLARYHAAGDRAAFTRLLGRLSLWLAAVTIVSVAVMAVAGPLVIGLLFGPAFVPYAAVATCLMLAAGVRNVNILLGRAITSMRRFRTGLALRVLGIAVLVPMLPGWIDWLGLLGAAWAVTIAWLITTLLSLAVVLHPLECDGSPSLSNTR